MYILTFVLLCLKKKEKTHVLDNPYYNYGVQFCLNLVFAAFAVTPDISLFLLFYFPHWDNKKEHNGERQHRFLKVRLLKVLKIQSTFTYNLLTAFGLKVKLWINSDKMIESCNMCKSTAILIYFH